MNAHAQARSQFERISMPADASFAWKAISGRHFDAPFHHHPEIELTQITAGQGQRFIGDVVEPFQPWDTVLIGPQLSHAWFSDARCRRSTAVVIQFHPDSLGHGLLHAQDMRQIQALLTEAQGGLVISATTAQQIAPPLATLHSLSPARRLATLIEVLDSLCQDSNRRCLQATSPVETVSLVDRRRLDDVLRFLHAEHTRPLTLTETAKVASLGPEAFSRFFRRVTGHTFIETLTQIRLATALTHLRNSTDTIASIAHASGFEDLSNFNRQFRRRYGITPGQARA